MGTQTTQAQLDQIAQPFEVHALAALQQGDITALRGWLQQMAQGQGGLDALSGHTLARKVGKLRQDLGEDKARAALQGIGAQMMKTWVAQLAQPGTADERREALRGAISDLVAVFKHQGGAGLQPLTETDDAVWLQLTPCGSGGRLERQGLPQKHPVWYGGWSDGVSSFCQACKANQAALNEALGAPSWTTEKGADGSCRLRFDKLDQRGQTLFSEAEQLTLTRTRVQQVEDRLALAEAEQRPLSEAEQLAIAPLLDGQRKDWKPWHDFGVVWLEYFYATALAVAGPDYLAEMLAQTYEPAFVAGFPRYAALSDDELVREIARTWNYHCADFHITEEDQRFVFHLDPCGSGGRLMRGQMWRDMFHYGEPMAEFMPAPHNINFNRQQAPTYCTHCAASNKAQLSRAADGSSPLFFVIDGHAQMKPGQACREFSYKKGADRSQLDPALLAQIGLAPPVLAATATTPPGDTR